MKVEFEGYAFGDRLLEQVYFQADIIDNKVSNVTIAPNSDGPYWEGLNHTKWLKEAKRYLEDNLASHGSVEALEGDEIVTLVNP